MASLTFSLLARVHSVSTGWGMLEGFLGSPSWHSACCCLISTSAGLISLFVVVKFCFGVPLQFHSSDRKDGLAGGWGRHHKELAQQVLQILQKFQFISTLLFSTRRSTFPSFFLLSIKKHCSLYTCLLYPCFWPAYCGWIKQKISKWSLFSHCLHFLYHLAVFTLAVCKGRRAGKVNTHWREFFTGLWPHFKTESSHISLLVWCDELALPLDRSSAAFSIRAQWKAFDRPASSPHYRMRVD